MSSKPSGSRVKLNIPKVRRNSGEVLPYTELPRRHRNLDQFLLWGTTLALFSMVLAGGALMWSWGRQSDLGPEMAIQEGGIVPSQILSAARTHYIEGRWQDAGSQGQLALALELASPSRPSLQKDIRRLLSLVALQQKDYATALEQLRWLDHHQPSRDDQSNLQFCQAQVNRSMEKMALDQLQGAQELLIQGQQQRALAEARQAVRALSAHQVAPRSLQAAHLVVVNIALHQGNGRLALLELREAQKAAQLGSQHLALLATLEKMVPAVKSPVTTTGSVAPHGGMSRMQVQVEIPRLDSQASYPRGRAGAGQPRPHQKSVPVQSQPEESEQAALAPSGKPSPKLELPKLHLPNNGGKPGALPSYQDKGGNSLPSYQDQSGSSLPGYSNKSRPRDSLPGY
ncbi:hypothetical protein IV102_29140 [bacterium]|nr:hypothetical protein [bacterium]